MPIQSSNCRYTFPVLIDESGVHYGLFLYDVEGATVRVLDGEVHSAVHVNGVLIKGVSSRAIVTKLTGCMIADDALTPRQKLERIWMALQGVNMSENAACALRFDGSLLPI